MAIDVYAAQHPGVPGRRSAQSVTVHLVSLALALEHDWDGAAVTAAKQALLRSDPTFPWLEPPPSLGAVTIADVLAASDATFDAVTEPWARSVWDAWEPHHAVIERHVRGLLRRSGAATG